MKDICFCCEGMYKKEELETINYSDSDIKCCPQCIFLIALYQKNGIHKKLYRGCLKHDTLNSKFKRIIDVEFNINRALTYEKYLGDVIHKQNIKHRVIKVPVYRLKKITEDFPFILLELDVFNEYKLKQGDVVTLVDSDGNSVVKCIGSVTKFTAEQAKKYGECEACMVLYLINQESENENA